jgi:hypothetical protein
VDEAGRFHHSRGAGGYFGLVCREAFSLKTRAMKIAKRRGLKKACDALARRLAVIMYAMLHDGTLFQALDGIESDCQR